MNKRLVEGVIIPPEMEDGDGARVRRAIGSPRLSYLDPFLLLDDFSIRPPAGFPAHPHRGFEIITYVLEGEVHHADSAGNREVVLPGGLQKITAGSGIVHSEFPGPDGGRGLQLWVNLGRADKGAEPAYRMLAPEEVPEVVEGPARLRLLAGEGTQVHFHLPVIYWDVTVEPDSTFRRTAPKGWTLFTYGLGGRGLFGTDQREGQAGEILIWGGDGEEMAVRAATEGELRFVVAAAPPLGEAIRRWGPFVD